jgi:V/A-type H+-transporting ATPase subunit E
LAGAEKLIEKIISDAQRDAESYWHDAEEKKKAMRLKVDKDIEKRKAEISRMADDAVRENKKRLAAVYDLEYRKQLLSAKQEVMAQAKALAMQKLAVLPDEKYLSLLKQRLIDCAGSGVGGIVVSKSEKRIGKAFLDDANKALKEKCGTGDVKLLSEKRDMTGGFVYVDGGLEIDMSLEALLSEAWQQSETDVAAVLFGA